jgi:hypothetical protein
MSRAVIPAIILTALYAQAQERKLIGTFESVPVDILKETTNSAPATLNDTANWFKEWTKTTVVVTEKDITLNGGLNMTYTTQGDFLLGKTKLGQVEMFYPIYIKDEDTLFIAGQKLVRKKDISK